MAVHFINPKHTERFREAINNDPEFKLSARQLTEDALLEVGDSQCIVKIRDGVITQIKVEPTNLNRWGFAIRAPIESWEKLLQPVPPPYFDSLWGGMIRGTFRLEGGSSVCICLLFGDYPDAGRYETSTKQNSQ